MSNNPVLQAAAALMADIYNERSFCPLQEERELLLNSGTKTPDVFFDICHLVFGMNMNSAFHAACLDTVNYCEFLLTNFDELMLQGRIGPEIDSMNMQIAAVEYLAVYAPAISIDEKAILDGLVYQARLCYRHLCKQFKASQRSR